MNIYEQIWANDVNAIPQAASANAINPKEGGFVMSTQNELRNLTGKDDKLFKTVVIPDHKKTTYDLIRKLFDNYVSSDTMRERVTTEEIAEIEDFIAAAVKTKAMETAREFLSFSVKEWPTFVKNLWFTMFHMGKAKDLSAFEHVFIGEQSGDSIGGYHFWYKFYCDEHDGHDEIDIHGFYDHAALPVSSTLRNTAEVNGQVILKTKGGFFNGVSPEGLLAICTVAALSKERDMVVDGRAYTMKVFYDFSGKNLRTVYPQFIGMAQKTDNRPAPKKRTTAPTHADLETRASKSGIQIDAILPNPRGQDAGNEKIRIRNEQGNMTQTILNTLTVKVNGHGFQVSSVPANKIVISKNMATITLPETVALPNNGATVMVYKKTTVLDSESYSEEQVSDGKWLNFQ